MMDDDKMTNTPNKDKVLDEMNDYISSTMSIPIIKLDDNGEMIKPEETHNDVSEDVHEIYGDKEEKVTSVEPINEEVFPTPPSEVEAVHDTPDPVVHEGIENVPEDEIPTYEPEMDTPNEPSMDAMNVVNETHANLEEPVVPSKPKKGKGSLVLGILIVLVGLGALGYFVIYPFIQNRFMSNPKNVFDVTIKQMAKNVNSYVDKAPKKNALFDINVKFESTIPELAPYSGYVYGIKSGIDADKKLLESGFYMKDTSSNEYSLKTYVKDNKNYLKVSSSEALIDLGESQVDLANTFKEYEEIMNNLSTNNNDLQHVITKSADLFVESIDEKKLSQEKATVTYKGSKINAEKNTYVLDKEGLLKTVDFILEGLEKDEISKTFIEKDGTTISSIREQLKELGKQETEFKEIKINIYTAGRKKDVIGYDIEADGKVFWSYFWDDKGYELRINELEYTFTGVDGTTQAGKINLSVVGTKDGDKTNVVIKAGDEEIGTLVINKWDEKGIDLEYVIKNDESNIKGIFKITIDESDDFSRYNMAFTLQSGSDKIGLEFNVDADYKAKVADIDTSTAVVPSQEELNQILNGFIGSLYNTPIGQLFGTLGGMYGESSQQELDQYYANNPSADPFNEAYVIG